MNYLSHKDVRDINGYFPFMSNCSMNNLIKKKYNIKSEAEYKKFLQKNPNIIEHFMEKEFKQI